MIFHFLEVYLFCLIVFYLFLFYILPIVLFFQLFQLFYILYSKCLFFLFLFFVLMMNYRYQLFTSSNCNSINDHQNSCNCCLKYYLMQHFIHHLSVNLNFGLQMMQLKEGEKNKEKSGILDKSML